MFQSLKTILSTIGCARRARSVVKETTKEELVEGVQAATAAENANPAVQIMEEEIPQKKYTVWIPGSYATSVTIGLDSTSGHYKLTKNSLSKYLQLGDDCLTSLTVDKEILARRSAGLTKDKNTGLKDEQELMNSRSQNECKALIEAFNIAIEEEKARMQESGERRQPSSRAPGI